jgi:hypothetical protein
MSNVSLNSSSVRASGLIDELTSKLRQETLSEGPDYHPPVEKFKHLYGKVSSFTLSRTSSQKLSLTHENGDSGVQLNLE